MSVRQRFQLQQQAFRRIAGADALGIEVLHPLEHRLGLGRRHREFVAQSLTNVHQRQRQIAGLVDGVDDGGGDRHVAVVERRQPHLPVQIIAQGFAGAGVALVGIPVLVLAARIAGLAVIRLVNVFPGAVHRQFVRQGGVGRRGVEFGFGAGVRRRLGGQGLRLHRQILRFVAPLQHQVGVEDGLHLRLQIQAG